MLLVSYAVLVAIAVVCSTFSLPIAIFVGTVAAVLALRAELRWIAGRFRPRVMLTPAPQGMPQREGSAS